MTPFEEPGPGRGSSLWQRPRAIAKASRGGNAYAAAGDLTVINDQDWLATVVDHARQAHQNHTTSTWPTRAQASPHQLGVHEAITTPDTPADPEPPRYIPRPHDQQIRAALRTALNSGRSVVLTVVGDSCTGKTRALHQALTDPTLSLGQWPIYHPRTQDDLTRQLQNGLPGGTIVWLDELQRYLDHTHQGLLIAQGLLRLLDTDPARIGGPLIITASLWPTTWTALTATPDDDATGAGPAAGAIQSLLREHPAAVSVTIPGDFRGADTTTLSAAARHDPRIALAMNTAGQLAQITQILAGGTQLLARWHPHYTPHPDTSQNTTVRFTPPQAAILTAAAELHRIGLTGPIPHPVLVAAAQEYLVDRAWAHPGWQDEALTELTQAASAHLNARHDIATHGPPPLAVTYPLTGETTYTLHDYLTQHHLTHHAGQPTHTSLWNATCTHQHLLDTATLNRIATSASRRGLYTTTRTLTHQLLQHLTRAAEAGDQTAQERLADLLADRGDTDALGAADNSRFARYRLVELLAARGDTQTLADRAGDGDWYAQGLLVDLLADQGDAQGLAAWADAGDPNACKRLAGLLANRGDNQGLQARARAGDQHALSRLVDRLAARGDTDALTSWARAGHQPARQQLIKLLAARDETQALMAWVDDADPDSRYQLIAMALTNDNRETLTARADAGDQPAQIRLNELLAACGELAKLTTRADSGDDNARSWVNELHAEHDDTNALIRRAHNGDKAAHARLINILTARGKLAELAAHAADGDEHAQYRLVPLLGAQLTQQQPSPHTPWMLECARNLVHQETPRAQAMLIGALLHQQGLPRATQAELTPDGELAVLPVETPFTP